MTIQVALQQGSKLLEEGRIDAPRLTAEVLLSHALRQERIYLYSHSNEELCHNAWLHYGRYLFQRLNGRPTQYITHKQEFYGREFRVTPDVLIPRPETEFVVEAALRCIGPGARVVDVGSGSGAIAVTLALQSRAEVWATDISGAALRVANENAHHLGARVRFVQCDLLSVFADRCLDVVVSNPPYVAHGEADGMQREVRDFEPHLALFAGPEGTEIYERIVREAERVLRPGGHLVFELGWKSLDAVRGMLGAGWSEPTYGDDLAGIPRFLTARWQ